MLIRPKPPYFYISLQKIADTKKKRAHGMRRVSNNVLAPLHTNPHRPFVFGYVGGVVVSGISLICAVACGGHLANSYANVKKFGKWRMQNSWEWHYLPADFPVLRWAGGFCGFLFWLFFLEPLKYNIRNSDLEFRPNWKRIGPF